MTEYGARLFRQSNWDFPGTKSSWSGQTFTFQDSTASSEFLRWNDDDASLDSGSMQLVGGVPTFVDDFGETGVSFTGGSVPDGQDITSAFKYTLAGNDGSTRTLHAVAIRNGSLPDDFVSLDGGPAVNDGFYFYFDEPPTDGVEYTLSNYSTDAAIDASGLEVGSLTIDDFLYVTGFGLPGMTMDADLGDLFVPEAPLDFTLLTPGRFSLGDTTTIDGVDYSVSMIKDMDGTVELEGGAPQPIDANYVTLTGTDGSVRNLVLPKDVSGELDGIEKISVANVGVTNLTDVDVADFAADDVVDVSIADAITLPDAIVVTDFGLPTDRLSVENGLLEGIDGPLTFDVTTPGRMSLGDNVDIGGTPYTVTGLNTFSGTHTLEDGSTGPINGTSLQLTGLDGGLKKVYLPRDLEGDMPDIRSIDINSIGTGGLDGVNFQGFTTDDDIDLVDPPTLPDMIKVSEIKLTGELLSVDNGSLVDLSSASGFTQTVPGQISISDTITMDGVDYTVTGFKDFTGNANLDDGSTVPVDGTYLTLTAPDGGIETFLMPKDTSGDLTDLRSVEITGTSLADPTAIDHTEYANDDTITVADPLPTNLITDDFLYVTGFGLPGEVISTQTGEILEPDAPLEFDQVDPTKLAIGDTATIDGVEYSVTMLKDMDGTVELDDGTTHPLDANYVTLTGTDGTIKKIVLPDDSSGDLSGIKSIDVTTVGTTNLSYIETSNVDEDDVVDVSSVEPITIPDVLLVAGPQLPGDLLSVSNGLIEGVGEPLVLDVSSPGLVSVGDTLSLGGGMPYTVSAVTTLSGTAVYGDDNDEGVGTVFDGLSITAIADDGTPVHMVLPSDLTGDLPALKSLDISSVGTFGLSEVPFEGYTQDDYVDLDEGPTLPDIIHIADLKVAGEFLSLDDGSLVEVAEFGGFTQNLPGSFSIGDTAEFQEKDLTVVAIKTVSGDAEIDDGAGGTMITPVSGAYMTLADDMGALDYFFLPSDASGDLPGLERIDINSVGLTDLTSIDPTDFELNDDIELGEPDPLTGFVTDVIVINGTPLEGDAMRIDSGELLGVEESMGFDLSTTGVLALGDTSLADGTLYTITGITSMSGKAVHSDEGGGLDTSMIDALSVTMSGTDGSVKTLLIPTDTSGDLPDIVEINVEDVNPTGLLDFDLGDVKTQQDVSILEGTPIYDFIEIPMLKLPGEVMRVDDDEIIGMADPMIFSEAAVGKLSVGDVTMLNDVEYAVTGLKSMTCTACLVDDAGVETPTIMDAYAVTMLGTDGTVKEYLAPKDTTGTLDGIKEIKIDSLDLTGLTDIEITPIKEFDGGSLLDKTPVFDGILMSHVPSTEETMSYDDGELIEIDEPLYFTAQTAGYIRAGDTTFIDGVQYTVTSTSNFTAKITQEDGSSGSETVSDNGGLIHLKSETGETLTYAFPSDDGGFDPHVGISEMTFTSISPVKGIQKDDFGVNDNVTLVCFGRGTLIKTKYGDLAVEDLTVGTLVHTMDNGLQPIRWIESTTVAAQNDHAPIVFMPGAIGNERELVVSPQHRMLIQDWRAELLFSEPEVLVPAKNFVNADTIYVRTGGRIEYFHMLFDQHEIIFSEGVPSESFMPSNEWLTSTEREVQNELIELFPNMICEDGDEMVSARLSLKRHEAALLLN